MGEQMITSLVTVATAIVGLTMVAVLVGQNAKTGSVISAAAKGFSQDISAAVAPVTGGSFGMGGVGDINLN